MKNEENQGFTSFDFVTMMFSFAVIVAITAPILKNNFRTDKDVEAAKLELGKISHTLLDPKTISSIAMSNGYGAPGERNVTSVHEDSDVPQISLDSLKSHLRQGEWEGDIGKDPWGSPYHFAFLHNKNGNLSHVAVWSDGPNHDRGSSIHAKIAEQQNPEAIKFDGDLGAVVPVR